MFELYVLNIDPDDPDFQAFIERYVAARDSRNPATIPYSQLYAMIKEAIREYIHKTQVSKQEVKK
jgi:hypothetical protein